MIETLVMLTVAVAVTTAKHAYDAHCARKPPVVSKRDKNISDDAFAVILKSFNRIEVPEEGPDGEKYDQNNVVRPLISALEDYALTLKQIKKLFAYTYTKKADADLKVYFGFDTALREIVDGAEEEAAKPKPPIQKYPLITDVEFKAFLEEIKVSTLTEMLATIEEWKRSFTLVQRAAVISSMQNDNKNDRKAMRTQVRAAIQIHVPEPETPAAASRQG